MAGRSPLHPKWRRWFGSRSERLVARYLKKRGYELLELNYHCPYGELDLIAKEDQYLVFVEVRSTEKPRLDRTEASVDEEKQRRLTNCALYYLKEQDLLGELARFDVVVVSWPPNKERPRFRHHHNAFDAVGKFQMFS